jgi:hypothetical protein
MRSARAGRRQGHHVVRRLAKLFTKVEDKRFFFEKMKQKDSGPAACGNSRANGTGSESFSLLFFKKEALP